MRFTQCLAAAALVATSAGARADLVSTDTYTLQYLFPDSGFDFGGSVSGSLPLTADALGGTVNVSVTGSSITFTSSEGSDVSFSSESFNGVELTDTTGTLGATSATLDAASVDPISPVISFSGNSVFFNFAGSVYNDDTVTTFDFGPSSPTPEPSSITLLGTGLLGAVGLIGRKLRA